MKNDVELRNVKGVNDYLPEEQMIRERIISVLKHNFSLFGYLPQETSILMHFDILASKYAGGSEILKEVYKLNDQGDRALGLRYDLTVPFCKVIGMQKDLVLPYRRYEIGKVFRDGPVKVGRNREFYQCDLDVCGIKSVECELEFFTLTKKVFDELKLPIEIHYNNRKLLMGILAYCGIEEGLYSNVILIVDKLEKISREDLVKELMDLGLTNDTVVKIFNILGRSLDYYVNEFKESDITLLREGINELSIINKYLNDLKMDYCVFKPFLARGLEIYTGTVWEIFDKSGYIKSSLGGGGRYDNIITKFIADGNEYPAVGMSFGLEPIYELVKRNNAIETPIVDVIIYPFNMNSIIFDLARTLRDNNIRVLIELNNSKLKKVLDFANKKDIPYVLIVGEDEISKKEWTLKKLRTGEQINGSINVLINEMEKGLNNEKISKE